MSLIDCFLLTLINAAICITLPIWISKTMGTTTNTSKPLRPELIPQKGFLNSSRLPKINTQKYNLQHSSWEIEAVPNLLGHNHNLRRKYKNPGKFI
jgi:hypothetical protein